MRQVLNLQFLGLLIFVGLASTFALRSSRYLPASPPHWISQKQEGQNWDQGGANRTQLVTSEFKKESRRNTKGNRITQKFKKGYSKMITAPFLSISSSFILPLWIPVPGGWYIINIDLIMVFKDAKMYISYKIAEKIRDYLVADWRANDRKEELLDHMNNIIDHGRILQIELFRILIWGWKWLGGPGYCYCYSSECEDFFLSWAEYESVVNQKKEIIQFLLGVLNQKKETIKTILRVRRVGPIKHIFTPHGSLQIFTRLKDPSIKNEIKKRSKFENKQLKALYNELYQDLLDSQIPWNATVQRDEPFKKRIKEVYDRLRLARKPISGSGKKDFIQKKILGLDVIFVFEPDHKAIKIEGVESTSPDAVFLGTVPICRVQLNDYRVNDPRKKTFGSNQLGFDIMLGVETRLEMTRNETLFVGLFLWYGYKFIFTR